MTTLALAACLLAFPTPAQDLSARLRELRLPIELADGELSGPGAELLLRAGRESLAFLLGEQHGNRETPRIAAALLAQLRPCGYGALAVEVGPLSCERLAERAARGQGVPPLHELLRAQPDSVPFFWWREECELLVAAAEQGCAIFGIDQEFLGSPRLHFERLRELATDEDARELVERRLGEEQRAAAHFAATGSSEQAFLSCATPADFDELASAFAGASDEALRTLAELRESAAIYQLFERGDVYASNARRIALMKRHLAERWTSAAGAPRVLVKLGNVHLGRGYSSLAQLVGNFAAEVAVLRGGASFHLTVLGLSRRELDGSLSDYRPELACLGLFGDPAELDWFVIDLRELRPLLFERGPGVEPTLYELVRSYDVALVVPELHAALRVDE